MTIRYEHIDNFPWGSKYFQPIVDAFGSRHVHVIELGAGPNPILKPEYLEARDVSYLASDISADELAKSDPVYERLIFDASNADIPPALEGKFDCVFSQMAAEHIKDGKLYHHTIWKLLKPGGISAHIFPTLWALPFAVNWMLPDAVSDRLLEIINPRDRHRRDKFPAYYSWARGPSKKMVERFEGLGYEIVEYIGYFGHGYYKKRVPFLHKLEMKKGALLAKTPVPALCSHAALTLRKL